MQSLAIHGLPCAPLDAAAVFHGQWLPIVRERLDQGQDLVLLFAAGDHSHRGWRLAAVQELAREHAPMRINALAGGNAAAVAASLDYLGAAPGVTGQYLVLEETA